MTLYGSYVQFRPANKKRKWGSVVAYLQLNAEDQIRFKHVQCVLGRSHALQSGDNEEVLKAVQAEADTEPFHLLRLSTFCASRGGPVLTNVTSVCKAVSARLFVIASPDRLCVAVDRPPMNRRLNKEARATAAGLGLHALLDEMAVVVPAPRVPNVALPAPKTFAPSIA